MEEHDSEIARNNSHSGWSSSMGAEMKIKVLRLKFEKKKMNEETKGGRVPEMLSRGGDL